MKIDLDELERKARAATPGPWMMHTPGCDPLRPICGWLQHHEAEGPFGGISATGPDVWTKEQALLDAAHIAANSPPVTLALIARIRELEDALDSCSEPGMDDWDEEYRDKIKAIVIRGTERQ